MKPSINPRCPYCGVRHKATKSERCAELAEQEQAAAPAPTDNQHNNETADCTWPRCHRHPNPCLAHCKCRCHTQSIETKRAEQQATRQTLQALSKAATPGPWNVDGPFWVDPPGHEPDETTVEARAGVTGAARALIYPGSWDTNDADAALIAAAVNYLRAVVDGPTTPGNADEAGGLWAEQP